MMREGLLKENIDGEALIWAHNACWAARTAPHPDGDFRRCAGG
jgi:cobalamin biosynthesis protein CobT